MRACTNDFTASLCCCLLFNIPGKASKHTCESTCTLVGTIIWECKRCTQHWFDWMFRAEMEKLHIDEHIGQGFLKSLWEKLQDAEPVAINTHCSSSSEWKSSLSAALYVLEGWACTATSSKWQNVWSFEQGETLFRWAFKLSVPSHYTQNVFLCKTKE